MHHIISDGWSLDIFLQNLGSLWSRSTNGGAPPLGELPIQYADYAIWRRQFLTEAGMEQHLNHWKQVLAGAPSSLKLPTDRDRKSVV